VATHALAAQTWAQEAPATLIWLVGEEPASLAPQDTVSTTVAQITAKLYDGLIELDARLNPKPALAESWSLSADALALTLRLRKDVLFHDGKPFTSADVRYSLLTLKERHPRGRSRFVSLEAVETPDPHTAVLRLNRPAPYLMSGLAAHESPMLPAHLAGDRPRAATSQADAAIGTGPFKLDRWQRGSEIRLVRNDRYWRPGTPALRGITVRFARTPSTARQALTDGSAHAAGPDVVAISAARALADEARIDLADGGSAWLGTLAAVVFNTRRPPFDRVEVRQAVALALDRESLVKTVWFGSARPARGPFHSLLAFADSAAPPVSTPSLPREQVLQNAVRLLEAAGYRAREDGVRLEIVQDVAPLGIQWQRLGEDIAHQLGGIGIKLSQRLETADNWLKRLHASGDFALSSMPVYTMGDPAIGLHRLLHGSLAGSGQAFANPSGWRNATADRAMDAATVAPHPDIRSRAYRALAAEILADAPMLFLAEPTPPAVVSRDFRDVFIPPLGPYGNFASARPVPRLPGKAAEQR
jgi:peptide/nickel transport system substrate-binding protein